MIVGLTIRIIQVLKVIRIEEGQNKKRMQTLIGGRRHKNSILRLLATKA